MRHRDEALSGSVRLDTLGCKLNQAETEALAHQFHAAGFRLAQSGEGADIYVLNSCTVTHVADRKSRHLLRMARRRNPAALIVVTGCYAQQAAEGLAAMEEVDLVLSNAEKARLVELVSARRREGQASYRGGPGPVGLRTRATVKAQEGCNYFCTYCVVPRVRGRERSVPCDEVVREVKSRMAQGAKEIVLTGTRIGAYGAEWVDEGLLHLVRRILTEAGPERLRLSSLQPQEISPELIDLWRDEAASGRLCRHLHLPLQSGSDGVLRRMGRRYTTAQYQSTVARLRQAVPDTAITTDVIVGFPGETEEDFAQTYAFCRKMAFSAIHVFPFSCREGTAAAHLPRRVDEKTRRERVGRMLDLSAASARAYREKFLGQTVAVLWEEDKSDKERIWVGHTDNYLRVRARSEEALHNRLLPAKLTAMSEDGLWGEVVSAPGRTVGNSRSEGGG